MSERSNTKRPLEADDASLPDSGQPPIPDGGLSDDMPEWLQRPPAWRGMTAREPEQRQLPPPDTSEIDPRTMVEIGDLPVWLQRIAARAAESESTREDPATGEITEPTPPALAAAGDTPSEPADADTGRPVAQAPPVITFNARPANQRVTRWRSPVVVSIVVVVSILIVAWVILVAV